MKLSIVHCPPVTMAIIKRPDPKYQLGFSVEDGIVSKYTQLHFNPSTLKSRSTISLHSKTLSLLDDLKSWFVVCLCMGSVCYLMFSNFIWTHVFQNHPKIINTWIHCWHKSEGLVMVPRWPATTNATHRCIHEPVLVLRQVYVGVMLANQSQPLLLRRLAARLQFFGRCTSGPCGGRKEGLQGRNGSVNPLALRRRGTIAQHLSVKLFVPLMSLYKCYILCILYFVVIEQRLGSKATSDRQTRMLCPGPYACPNMPLPPSPTDLQPDAGGHRGAGGDPRGPPHHRDQRPERGGHAPWEDHQHPDQRCGRGVWGGGEGALRLVLACLSTNLINMALDGRLFHRFYVYLLFVLCAAQYPTIIYKNLLL